MSTMPAKRINLETSTDFAIPSIEVVSRFPKKLQPGVEPTEQIYTKAIFPKKAARNFQIAVPRRASLDRLPMVIAVGGTYEDETGQIALYDPMREIKVTLRCHKTPGLERLLEYQERCYSDILGRLNTLRPQPATGLQWTPTPFIHDLGNDFVDISIKFVPTMMVRVVDAQNLEAEPTTKPLFQLQAGERVVSPFTLTKPWAMDGRTDREGNAQAPIFGMSAKSSSGTGGDTQEERDRGMVTVIVNVEDSAGAAVAGEGLDDAAQPSAPKRRKGVQSDLGDLA